MGRVYLGRSAAGRLVAVKTIKVELADEPDFRTRFAQEVAAARRVSGAFTAAVDLFSTMIGLAEVWIKGAISTAVIFSVFAAPYLVVREVKRLIRKARATKEFDGGRELGRAVREGHVSEDEVHYKIDVASTSAAKIMGVAVELCPERLPQEVFDGPTGDIKVDGPRAYQVYYEELSEWCAYGAVREGRLSEDDVRGEFEQGHRRVPRSWLEGIHR